MFGNQWTYSFTKWRMNHGTQLSIEIGWTLWKLSIFHQLSLKNRFLVIYTLTCDSFETSATLHSTWNETLHHRFFPNKPSTKKILKYLPSHFENVHIFFCFHCWTKRKVKPTNRRFPFDSVGALLVSCVCMCVSVLPNIERKSKFLSVLHMFSFVLQINYTQTECLTGILLPYC